MSHRQIHRPRIWRKSGFCVHDYMWEYTRVCTCVHAYMHMCVCECVCVFLCVTEVNLCVMRLCWRLHGSTRINNAESCLRRLILPILKACCESIRLSSTELFGCDSPLNRSWGAVPREERDDSTTLSSDLHTRTQTCEQTWTHIIHEHILT